MPDVSIVIPSRDDEQGLFFTLASASVELAASGLTYEIIAVIDGDWNETARSIQTHQWCRIIQGDFGGPQRARHVGILEAKAERVFFFDSHVVVSPGFFRRMLDAMDSSGAALVHSPHSIWNPAVRAYGYRVFWLGHFWSSSAEDKPKSPDPYPVALCGHGAMLVDKQKYFDTGGYWQALRGWGGEEPQLNFKFWMLGHECWVCPQAWHMHYFANRRSAEIYRSPDYIRNFLLVAYATGGDKFLNSAYQYFTMAANGKRTPEEVMKDPKVYPWKEIMERVPEEAAEERQRICAGPYGGDLDSLRKHFEEKGIPN